MNINLNDLKELVPNDGEWHAVCVWVKEGSITVYVDGERVK